MNVSEIMTTDFEMIDSTYSLTEAAEKMKSLNVGFLPVREGTRLIGLLTDRDIVIRGLSEGLDPGSTQVKDILSSEVVYCYDDDSVEDAARLMEDNQIRRLVIVNHDQTPVGILSIGDIAVKSGQEELAGEILERISEPAAPVR
ncbi:MAG: CBS domain-containing protein [Planctomycetes bacterium]|nr:CBS domain-containing protein [Planctomycetota bacterium]